jgi:predicted negative regulator of RcsB-dependent stress response
MPTLSPADPVLETQVFWERHKKEVFAVLIVTILAVAAWGAYWIYTDRRDAAAANLLASAKTAADFQKVIAQYPATPAGASANLFLADEQRKEKKFTEANATLQAFIDKYPKHGMRGTARITMAANLESLGKRDEALAAYQRLAADDPDGFTAPMAMLSQVHLLKEKNQLEEARRVCETILTKYRESLVAGEATRQLRLLKGPEDAAIATASPTPTPGTRIPPLLARPKDRPTATPAAATSPTATPSTESKPRKRSRRR